MKINLHVVSIVTGFVLVLISFALAIYLYPQLPERIPTHWNAAGQIDGYTSKPWSAFEGTVIMFGLWVLFWIVSRLYPRLVRDDDRIASFRLYFGPIALFVMVIVLIVTCSVLVSAAQAIR